MESQKLCEIQMTALLSSAVSDWLKEWPFIELFFYDPSFSNQYKLTTFNVSLCRVLIISFKILIITVISNDTTNELTTYVILCEKVTLFYGQNFQKLNWESDVWLE